MTAAQRATLELMVERGGTQCGRMCGDFETHEMDALRAALGTCGTCRHADTLESRAGMAFCAAPVGEPSRHPFRYQAMPLGERCTGYTPRSDE